MKIPLKYGLLITLGLAVWVLVVRSIVTNPQSIVHTLGTPVFFNVLQFAMIYLGLKALEHERGDRPTFKEGLKTGVAISFVYGLAIRRVNAKEPNSPSATPVNESFIP
jgi:hypothetical protein